mmetsp:Transcript_33847/g.44698  ORF Transcript_33847/g.44698 Transcript_33847/m.44698 type:complete len:98 (+) Transcript_33847:1136-1429(+)
MRIEQQDRSSYKAEEGAINADMDMPNLQKLIQQDYDRQTHMDHGPRSTVRSQVSHVVKSMPKLSIPSGRKSFLGSRSDFNELGGGGRRSSLGEESQN